MGQVVNKVYTSVQEFYKFTWLKPNINTIEQTPVLVSGDHEFPKTKNDEYCDNLMKYFKIRPQNYPDDRVIQ